MNNSKTTKEIVQNFYHALGQKVDDKRFYMKTLYLPIQV